MWLLYRIEGSTIHYYLNLLPVSFCSDVGSGLFSFFAFTSVLCSVFEIFIIKYGLNKLFQQCEMKHWAYYH